MSTIFNDTFAGTTGATIVGHAPDTPNGSDAWAANGIGDGDLAFAAGGGVAGTGSGGSSSSWSSFYPMTGAGQDGVFTLAFRSANSATTPTFYLRTDAGLANLLDVEVSYPLQRIKIGKTVAGTFTDGFAVANVTLATGTDYTLEVTLSGTTLVGVKLNGSALGTLAGVTIPAAVGRALWLRQQFGSAGDVAFKSANVADSSGASTATFAGPTTGTTGAASTAYTVTLNAVAPTGGTPVALTGGSAGTFAGANVSGSTLTIPAGQTVGTFTYTKTASGAQAITPTSAGVAFTPPSITYTASTTLPSTATFAGPTTGTTGSASSAYTVTLNLAAPTGGTPVALTGGSAGTFAGTNVSGSTLTILAGQTVGTFTYTKTAGGAQAITPTSSGVTFTPTSITYTASSTAATAFTLTGPSTGVVGIASNPFTVTPNGTTSGTFTPTPVTGVTFSPATLTWTGDAAAKTFTAQCATAKVASIAGTFSPTLTAPSAVSFTFTEAPSGVSYLSGVRGFPAGLVGGTSSGFGYKVSVDGGGYGSLVTTGITAEEEPGCYSAMPVEPSGSLLKVKWYSGTGTTVTDLNVQVAGGSGGSGGSGGGATIDEIQALIAPLLDPLNGFPAARGGSTTTVRLAAGTGAYVAGQQVVMLSGAAKDQIRAIDSVDPTSLVATVEAWDGGAAVASGDLYALAGASATLDLTQLLPAPRDVSSLPDNQVTYADVLWATLGAAAGDQTINPTTRAWVIKTPAGTTVRTFALDSVQGPLARS